MVRVRCCQLDLYMGKKRPVEQSPLVPGGHLYPLVTVNPILSGHFLDACRYHTLLTLYGFLRDTSRWDPKVGHPASTISLHLFLALRT